MKMEDPPVPSILLPAPEPATELGRYRVLSANAGLRVSPLCLGGMSIGQAWSGFMGSMSKDDSFKLLDAFYEAGGNFIDTACNYQDEESEKWIGEWMAARGNRDQLVLATKYTADYRSYALGKGKAPNAAGNHRKSVHMSMEASLRKLQTSYIDILYMHWWDHTTSIKEIMDSLHIFVQQGKVLYLGISDTPAWIVSAANQYAVDHGRTPFCIYQGRWNIMTRDLERDIVPMCRQFGMAIAPWDVLGGGRFQSRKALAERTARGEPLRTFGGSRKQTADEERISEVLDDVATELGVSVAAVALAWIRAKAPNVFPIVGGRRVEHLHDNINALGVRLSEEQMKQLEEAKPFNPGFPSAFLGDDPNITGHNYRLALTAPMAFPNARQA